MITRNFAEFTDADGQVFLEREQVLESVKEADYTINLVHSADLTQPERIRFKGLELVYTEHPSADGEVEPGRRLINFVWYRNYAEGEQLDDLLTDRNGRQRELSM